MTAIRYVRGTLPGFPGEHDIAVLEGDTHISRWVEESRRLDHDQSSLPRIGRLITPESVVWDVGAFIGDHSAFYASKASQVMAFEAMPDAFECLELNLARYPNAFPWRAVVGDGNKTAAFAEDMDNKGARWLRCANAPTVHAFWSMRLDDVQSMSTSLHPTLIKLDIEGWEVRALCGAERTIREHRPSIVCEVNRGALERSGASPEELHALLTGYGYEMRDLFTEEVWIPDDARPQFDVVAYTK